MAVGGQFARDATFRAGHGRGADWAALVESCLDQMLPLPPSANLGFVYLTDRLADRAADIVDRLRLLTGVADWVGTVGIGICAEGTEYFDEPAMALLLAALPPDSLSFITRPDKAARGAFGIIHADPALPALPEVLADLADSSGAFLVGGLPSSRRGLPHIAGRETGEGLSGVMFAPDVTVLTGLSQGCTPLGPWREVTESEGGVLVTLDGARALDCFRADLGPLANDLARAGRTVMCGIGVPGDDRGDYVVRHLTGLDTQNGLLALGALVEPGQRVMFVRRDADAAKHDMDRMLADLVRRLDGRPVRGALYHSCLARGPNLFGPGNSELRRIRAALGPVPLAGLFANGEIARGRLYAYTGVLTLFL